MNRTTPLHRVHEDLGARMIDFAGWDMPVWYDSAIGEHHAVRTAAGLFDLSHMAELFVTGPQAAAALDRSLLIDATAMPVGRARYSMICNEMGGIIDDLIVYRLGDNEFMVVANASNGPVVFDELVERSASFDAIIDDRTDAFALVAVQGPLAESIVLQLTGPELGELRYYRVAEVELTGEKVSGVTAYAARTGYTGEDGFELFVPAEHGVALWQALSAAGEPEGLVPVGLAARDTLRLEAGMPLYGNELTLETTPFDVGSARLVKPKPDWYVGGSALAAVADEPHDFLVGLHIDGRRPARAGYEVTSNDRVIGVITSGGPSPTLNQNIAIARLDNTPMIGDTVHVDVRGTMTSAIVVELPFYRRPE
jgi:aminomethyltransferase